MNRDLLEALGAVAADFYHDAIRRYPGLLREPETAVDDEALAVWRVLTALDELWVPIHAAKAFDDHRDRPVEPVQEELPF